MVASFSEVAMTYKIGKRNEFEVQIEPFLKWLKAYSALVKKQGQELVGKLGPHRLKDFAKVHFKTAYEILGLPVPQKPPYF